MGGNAVDGAGSGEHGLFGCLGVEYSGCVRFQEFVDV